VSLSRGSAGQRTGPWRIAQILRIAPRQVSLYPAPQADAARLNAVGNRVHRLAFGHTKHALEPAVEGDGAGPLQRPLEAATIGSGEGRSTRTDPAVMSIRLHTRITPPPLSGFISYDYVLSLVATMHNGFRAIGERQLTHLAL
jgi:hypothetical protein